MRVELVLREPGLTVFVTPRLQRSGRDKGTSVAFINLPEVNFEYFPETEGT